MAKYLMSERTAAFVRGLMERRAPTAAAVATTGRRSVFGTEDCFAHPFEVRCAPVEGSDDLDLIVWLPSDSVLVVGGEKIDVSADLPAAGSYPDGWYVLDFMPAEGESARIYLNVHLGESLSADWSDSPSDEDDDMPVLIADVSRDSQTGACTIKQTVDSAIVIGGRIPNVNVTPSPFEFSSKTEIDERTQESRIVGAIRNNYFWWEGVRREIEDYEVQDMEGETTVYLVAERGEESPGEDESSGEDEWTFSLTETIPGGSDYHAVSFALYDIKAGSVVMDYRTTFLALSPPLRLSAGDDTDIRFTYDPADGRIKVDVYYK